MIDINPIIANFYVDFESQVLSLQDSKTENFFEDTVQKTLSGLKTDLSIAEFMPDQLALGLSRSIEINLHIDLEEVETFEDVNEGVSFTSDVKDLIHHTKDNYKNSLLQAILLIATFNQLNQER